MQKGVPISPTSVLEMQSKIIPPFVIDCFNELIARNFVEIGATIYQADIESLIKTKMPVDMQFDHRWLNVEPLFREIGWLVHYDKPGFNESYAPSFSFTYKK